MSLNIKSEEINEKCRICLENGDANIWHYKVPFKGQHAVQGENFCMEDSIEKSFVEIMDIFFNSKDLLNLTDEFPLICWKCLEDLKFCYIIYEKIKLANIKLRNLYHDTLNQCIEEEHLIEVADENELNEIKNTNLIETLEEENILNLSQYKFENENKLSILKKSVHSKQITPDKNNTFIVTQFIPETIGANERYQSKDNDEGLFQPPQHLLTVNLKAVEVKDLNNLDKREWSQHESADITGSAVYICQYCPQAFAKSDYLKTHIQKSHVCKFCTQPFSITEDLFRHIREVHTENKCPVCHKTLSSRTNLRHHIKRVHRIEVPPKVTLIDFIKSTPAEESKLENEVEILQEELEAPDIDLNTQYFWSNDDAVEIFNYSNTIN